MPLMRVCIMSEGKGQTRSLKQEVLMPKCDSMQIRHISELRLSKLLIGRDMWWSS